ncbi:MAG: SgcJ/EcaC family oxidoreductase [Pyrinomonadaceae bacterium]
MKNGIGNFVFAAVVVCLVAAYDALGQAAADETAIRQMAQTMQDGWNRKDGKMFASPFAEEHGYVNVWGLYIPKASRDGNAKAHQGLFDGPYKEMDVAFSPSKIKFLSPEIAVMHIQGRMHPKGKSDETKGEVVITAVVQKRAGKWEIVAFQNTPVATPPYQRPPVQPAAPKN